MGRKRASWSTSSDQPDEDGAFVDDCLDWVTTPECRPSIEAIHMVFDALEKADVDPEQRKIIWPDGQRLSIERSTERIHAMYPDMPLDMIEPHVFGWLENCAPEHYSEHEMEELDRLIQPWLDDYERALDKAEK